MLEHEDVAEAAVLGVEDEVFGQRVGAFVRAREGSELGPEELRAWMKERVAPYCVPGADILRFTGPEGIPKNHMGKVNKKSLAPLLAEGGGD